MRAHDLARAHGGRFLLRIEDIDPAVPARSMSPASSRISNGSALHWDGPVLRQSARLDVVCGGARPAAARDLVYPCTCTRAEIAAEIAASASARMGPARPATPAPAARGRRSPGAMPPGACAWTGGGGGRAAVLGGRDARPDRGAAGPGWRRRARAPRCAGVLRACRHGRRRRERG
jgi:hypothetical protein